MDLREFSMKLSEKLAKAEAADPVMHKKKKRSSENAAIEKIMHKVKSGGMSPLKNLKSF